MLIATITWMCSKLLLLEWTSTVEVAVLIRESGRHWCLIRIARAWSWTRSRRTTKGRACVKLRVLRVRYVLRWSRVREALWVSRRRNLVIFWGFARHYCISLAITDRSASPGFTKRVLVAVHLLSLASNTLFSLCLLF